MDDVIKVVCKRITVSALNCCFALVSGERFQDNIKLRYMALIRTGALWQGSKSFRNTTPVERIYAKRMIVDQIHAQLCQS